MTESAFTSVSSVDDEAFIPRLNDEQTVFKALTIDDDAFIPSIEKEDKSFTPVNNLEEEAFIPRQVNVSDDARPAIYQEAEPEGILANLFKGVMWLDRGRSANAHALIEIQNQVESGEIDGEAIRQEMGKGYRGEDHPMMLDKFREKLLQIQENPEDYPNASKILPIINWALHIPNILVDQLGQQTTDPMRNPLLLIGAMIYPKNKEGNPSWVLKEAQKSMERYTNSDWAKEQRDRILNPKTLAVDKIAFLAGFITDVAIDPITYSNPIIGITKRGLMFAIPDAILTQLSKSTGQSKAYIKNVLLTTNSGQLLNRAANQVWKMFSTKHGLNPQMQELQERFKNMVAAARLQSVRDNEALRARIKEYTKEVNKKYKTNISVEDVNKFITEAVERGGIPNVDFRHLSKDQIKILAENDNLRYEIWSLATKQEEQLFKEITMGVPLRELGEQVLVQQADDAGELLLFYFNHAITPQAKKAAVTKQIAEGTTGAASWKKARYYFNNTHTSILKRKEQWKGLTINDINEMAKKGTLPGYEGQIFKKGFFYDDVAVAQALRDFKHHKSIAAAILAGELMGVSNPLVYKNAAIEFLQKKKPNDWKKLIAGQSDEDVLRIATESGWKPTTILQGEGFGISPDDLMRLANEAGFLTKTTNKRLTPHSALKFLQQQDKSWENYKISKNDFTEGYALPEEIIEFVDNTFIHLHNPKQINEFLTYYDGMTRWYKSWTLSLFPGYHARNMVGNMWNNYVMGVNPKTYKDALRYQVGITEGTQGFIRVGKEKMSFNKLRDLIEEYGITGRGMFTADIESTLIQEIGKAKWLTLSSQNKAIMIGKRVGESIENNARVANFIDGLRKGMNPSDAAKRVKKTLFDYSDLTDFEQKTMKRIFPFYTWTRKNVPYQIEMIIKHPGKYKAIDTLRMEIGAAVEDEREEEKFLSAWMLANYPTKIKVGKDGNPRYFMLGGWWAGADVWKLGSQPVKLFTDLLHPLLKVLYESINPDEDGYITDLFTGKRLHPDLDTDYLFGWDGKRFSISETNKHYLNNLRVLNTIDGFINSYYTEKYPDKKRISAFERTPTTIEEALIHFFTGVKTFSIDLEDSKLFAMKDIQNEIAKIKQRKTEAIKRRRPPEELAEFDQQIKDLLNKLKGYSGGGIVSQMQRLNFAEGGIVLEEDSDKGWLGTALEGVSSEIADTAKIAYKGTLNTIEESKIPLFGKDSLGTQTLGKIADAVPAVKKVLSPADSVENRREEISKLQEELQKNTPPDLSLTQQGVRAAVVSSPLTLAAMVASFMGSPMAGLALMGSYTGALEFEDARKEGKNYVQSLAYGSVQGTIEGVTERFGLGPLMRMLKKQGGIGKEAVAYATRELIGENAAEFGQSMVSWYAGLDEVLSNPKLSKKDRMWIQAQRQYVASVAALSMSGTTTAGKAGVDVVSQMANLQMPPPKTGPVDRTAETKFQERGAPEYFYHDDGTYTTFYPIGDVGMDLKDPHNLEPLTIPNTKLAAELFKKRASESAIDRLMNFEGSLEEIIDDWQRIPFDRYGTKGWTTKMETMADNIAKRMIATSGGLRQLQEILDLSSDLNIELIEEQQALSWLLGKNNTDFKLHKFQRKQTKETDDFMDDLVLVKTKDGELALINKNLAKNVDADGNYKGQVVAGNEITVTAKWNSWRGKPSTTDYMVGTSGILDKFKGKKLGKRLYLKMMDELIKKGGESLSSDNLSMSAIRVWKGLIKTSDQDLIDLGFPQLVGVLNVDAPAFELVVQEAKQSGDLTSMEAMKFDPYSKDYDPYETNELGNDLEIYTKHIEPNGTYSLEGMTVEEDAAIFSAYFNTRKYKENIVELNKRREGGENIKQYQKQDLPWKIGGKRGDLYIQRIGPNAGTVSKTRTSANDIAITLDQTKLLPDFTYYVLQHLQPQIQSRATGTAQQAIKGSDISDVLIEHFSKRQEFSSVSEERISSEEAIKQAKEIPLFAKLINAGKVEEVKEIFTPDKAQAWGSYRSNMIEFIKNPTETTLPHETFHAFVDLFAEESQKQAAFNAVKLRAGNKDLSDAQVEEVLAEEFATWFIEGRKPKGTVEKFFAHVKKLMKTFTQDGKITKLFDQAMKPQEGMATGTAQTKYQEREEGMIDSLEEDGWVKREVQGAIIYEKTYGEPVKIDRVKKIKEDTTKKAPANQFGMYSQLEEALLNMPIETNQPQDVLKYLKKNAVTNDEVRDSGMFDFLKDSIKKKNSVTKTELIKQFHKGSVTNTFDRVTLTTPEGSWSDIKLTPESDVVTIDMYDLPDPSNGRALNNQEIKDNIKERTKDNVEFFLTGKIEEILQLSRNEYSEDLEGFQAQDVIDFFDHQTTEVTLRELAEAVYKATVDAETEERRRAIDDDGMGYSVSEDALRDIGKLKAFKLIEKHLPKNIKEDLYNTSEVAMTENLMASPEYIWKVETDAVDGSGHIYTVQGNKVQGYAIKVNTVSGSTVLPMRPNDPDSMKRHVRTLAEAEVQIKMSEHRSNPKKGAGDTKFAMLSKVLPNADMNTYKETIIVMESPEGGTFKGGYPYSHWTGYDNNILHLRTTEREDSDGNKILFIEELQSDWNIYGQEHGWRDKAEFLKVTEETELRNNADIATAKESIIKFQKNLRKLFTTEVEFLDFANRLGRASGYTEQTSPPTVGLFKRLYYGYNPQNSRRYKNKNEELDALLDDFVKAYNSSRGSGRIQDSEHGEAKGSSYEYNQSRALGGFSIFVDNFNKLTDESSEFYSYTGSLYEPEDSDGERKSISTKFIITNDRLTLQNRLSTQETQEKVLKEELKFVPKMPANKNWHELGMRVAVQMAVEGGFNRIAWTNSTDQVSRWGKGPTTISKYNKALDKKIDMPIPEGANRRMYISLYDNKMGGYAQRLAHTYNSEVGTFTGEAIGIPTKGTLEKARDEETTMVARGAHDLVRNLTGAYHKMHENHRQYLEITPEMIEAVKAGRLKFYRKGGLVKKNNYRRGGAVSRNGYGKNMSRIGFKHGGHVDESLGGSAEFINTTNAIDKLYDAYWAEEEKRIREKGGFLMEGRLLKMKAEKWGMREVIDSKLEPFKTGIPSQENVLELEKEFLPLLKDFGPNVEEWMENIYNTDKDSWAGSDHVSAEDAMKQDQSPWLNTATAGSGTLVGKQLTDWFNKGYGQRIPNEATAKWGELFKDSAKQLTRTDKAFQAGEKGLKGWRPLNAFTSKMLATGPDAATRQLLLRAPSLLSKASPWLQAIMPGKLHAGTVEEWEASQASILENRRGVREDARRDKRTKRKIGFAEAAQAKAEAKAQADLQAKKQAEAQAQVQAQAKAQAEKQAKAQAKAHEKAVIDSQGNRGYTGQGSQSRAGNRTSVYNTQGSGSSGGSSRNYGVTGKRVTGGR